MHTSIIDARDEDLYLVTAHAEGIDGGMIATWITQASMSTKYPRIAAVLSPRNRTTELIEQGGRFVVQQLAEEQLELVPRFGLYSGRDTQKFEGLELSRAPSNSPIVAGSRGWIDCQVAAKIDAGDRFVYLADIRARSPVEIGVRGLRASVAFSRLPPDLVQALSRKRERTVQLDDELVAALHR